MKNLRDLFLHELADILDAEKRIGKALTTLADTTDCKHLKPLLQTHQKETETHIQRVKEAFDILGEKPHTETCQATVGLVKEAEKISSDFKGSPTHRAAIVCAMQKIEHYEIATYGSLCQWADLLEEDEVKTLLGGILDEEKTANALLSEVAKKYCNPHALGDSPKLVSLSRA